MPTPVLLYSLGTASYVDRVCWWLISEACRVQGMPFFDPGQDALWMCRSRGDGPYKIYASPEFASLLKNAGILSRYYGIGEGGRIPTPILAKPMEEILGTN